jgi:hypothetical protein
MIQIPPVNSGLSRQVAASFDKGAVAVRCEDDMRSPPAPLISGGFGAMEGHAFGDLEVTRTVMDAPCWTRKGEGPDFPEQCLNGNHVTCLP